jgi:hypothetical protein
MDFPVSRASAVLTSSPLLILTNHYHVIDDLVYIFRMHYLRVVTGETLVAVLSRTAFYASTSKTRSITSSVITHEKKSHDTELCIKYNLCPVTSKE